MSCDDQGDGGDEGDERETGDEGECDTLFFLPFLRFAGGDMILSNNNKTTDQRAYKDFTNTV